MSKVCVVYWSQSGNTQAMAEAVGKGASDAGADVSVVYVGDATLDALKECKAFALGCPAMGAEVLEEAEDGAICCRCRRHLFRKDNWSVRLLRMGRWPVDA